MVSVTYGQFFKNLDCNASKYHSRSSTMNGLRPAIVDKNKVVLVA